MTLLRIVLMLCVGVLLFVVLLHVSGRLATIRLRRRKRMRHKNQPMNKDAIIKIYLLILIAMVLLSFLYIRLKSRGML